MSTGEVSANALGHKESVGDGGSGETKTHQLISAQVKIY